MPKYQLVLAHIPSCFHKSEALSLLQRQNPGLHTELWRCQGEPRQASGCFFLNIFVDPVSLEALRKLNFHPYCGASRAYFKTIDTRKSKTKKEGGSADRSAVGRAPTSGTADRGEKTAGPSQAQQSIKPVPPPMAPPTPLPSDLDSHPSVPSASPGSSAAVIANSEESQNDWLDKELAVIVNDGSEVSEMEVEMEEVAS